LTNALKQILKSVITRTKLLQQILNRLSGDFPKVFVYHRFAPPGKNNSGFLSADEFAWQLDQIKGRFRVITLDECLSHFRNNGVWPRRSVIITIDDGYRDFYEFAFPELVKRGLTATFFVTVNFVERKVWLWPDRLEFAIRMTKEEKIRLMINDRIKEFPLYNDIEKHAAWQEISTHCLILADDDKKQFIDALLAVLRVGLPDKPTPEYEAVTWSDLQNIMAYGIEIGSHTINHPILSRLTQKRLAEEIGGSKAMLEDRLGTNVTTFCYPNSDPADINESAVEEVKRHGYRGAVFGINLKAWDPFLIPRMGVTENRDDFLWKLYGGEALTIR
jgi:peptidoglycan/xylan/chitin deacetylase (PgdA/CDA1 family)